MKWLLLLLLFLPAGARAVNSPLVLHRCAAAAPDLFVATINCVVGNVTAGNTIILDIHYEGGSETITSTETFTCPAGSFNNSTISGHVYHLKKCYVVLASNHASFTIQLTAVGSPAASYTLNAREYQGLSTVDGSSGANAGNTLSLVVTTANSGEWIDTFCSDFSHSVSAGASMIQMQQTQSNPLDVSQWRGWSGYRIGAGAGNYTVACTTDTTSNFQQIVGLAFQVGSPPAPPAVLQAQECAGTTANSGSAEQECTLANVVAGNAVVVGYLRRTASTTPVCTELCSCPAGAAANQIYGGQTYYVQTCYVFLASSHALFSVRLNNAVAWLLAVYEVSGIVSFDSGSGCAASATSCTYSTVTTNEWTFMFAADTHANPMVPGNSFEPRGYLENVTGALDQAVIGAKTTVSSGTNTASYTETGSTTPMISAISFGPSPIGVRHKVQIF